MYRPCSARINPRVLRRLAPDIHIVHVPRSVMRGWREPGGPFCLVVALLAVCRRASPMSDEKTTGESGPPLSHSVGSVNLNGCPAKLDVHGGGVEQ